MRGKSKSGYYSPVMLQIKLNYVKINYLEIDRFLNQSKEVSPKLTNDRFTEFFGKINGTRVCALKHLEGGSVGINQMKLIENLICKEKPDVDLVLICAACSPSQQLKENNQYKFSILRVVLEAYENRKFLHFLEYPCTICDCPNGFIFGANLGRLLLFCVDLCKYNE